MCLPGSGLVLHKKSESGSVLENFFDPDPYKTQTYAKKFDRKLSLHCVCAYRVGVSVPGVDVNVLVV